MRTKLCTTQHGTFTHQAMIMRLFHAIDTFSAIIGIAIVVLCIIIIVVCILIGIVIGVPFRLNGAWFIVGHLPETNRSNVFQFTVMTSMSHHFIRVRADEIAFQAMEMGRFIVCT